MKMKGESDLGGRIALLKQQNVQLPGTFIYVINDKFHHLKFHLDITDFHYSSKILVYITLHKSSLNVHYKNLIC